MILPRPGKSIPYSYRCSCDRSSSGSSDEAPLEPRSRSASSASFRTVGWLSYFAAKLQQAVAKNHPSSVLDAALISQESRKSTSQRDTCALDASIVKLRLALGDTVTCLAVCEEHTCDASKEPPPTSQKTRSFFAAGIINKRVRVYDLRTGDHVRAFIASSPIACLALSIVHGRTKLILGTFNGRVMCFDLEQEGEEAEVDFICFSGEPLSAIKLSKSLTPLSKSSDAELMAVGGQVSEVLLYKLTIDSTSPRLPAIVEQVDRIPFPSPIRDVALDNAGELLAIAGEAKCVTLWELSGDRQREGPQDNHPHPSPARNVTELRQNLKRTRVALMFGKAMRQGGINHDPKSARKLLHVFHTKSAVHSIGLTGSGDKLAIGTAQHHTMVWQLTHDSESGLRTEPLLGLPISVQEGAVSFSGNGDRLVVGSGNAVQVFNMISGATVSTFKREARMRTSVLSHTGSHLLVGGFDRCVSIYKVDEGARQFRFRDVLKDVRAMAATEHSSDDIIVVGGSSQPNAANRAGGVTVVFHISSGEALARWERAKPVYALALTRSGAQCAVGAYDNQVIVHDVASGSPQQTYTYESAVGPAFIWSCSFSASGDRMAVGCWNHKAYVYANPRVDESGSDSDSDEFEMEEAEDSLPVIRESRGLRFLAREEIDESYRKVRKRYPLARQPDPEPYAEFTRTDRVYAANLTHDGERLLVGGRDKRVVMYQIHPMRKLWSYGATDVVYSASLSKDSSVCAVGGPMDHVTVLDCEDGSVLHVVHLTETAHSVRMMGGGRTILVGGEQLLEVLDVATSKPQHVVQLDEAAQCLLATEHSLVVGAGACALMYGKPMQHFGWRETPSFEFAASLLKSDEYAMRCLTPLVQAHPLLVNALEPSSGRTLLHHAIQSSGDEDLLERLLKRAPEVSMTRDQYGHTSLHIAIALGRRKAVGLLLTAITDGRVSLIPDSLEPIIGLFNVIARKYPSEFLHFLSLMPLDEEKQVLLESEREAQIGTIQIRGSPLRAPVHLGDHSFWADYFPHVHQAHNGTDSMSPLKSGADGRPFSPSRHNSLFNLSNRMSTHLLTPAPADEGWQSVFCRICELLRLPWQQILEGEDVGRVPVHAMRVPFASFAGFYHSVEESPLFLILQASDKTGDRRAFASPIVSVLIQFKWQAYGKNLFLFQFGVFLLYICVNTAFSWLCIKELQAGDLTHTTTVREAEFLLLLLPFTLFVLYLLFLEVMQALHQPLWTTLRNPWNWMQYYAIATQLILCITLPLSFFHSEVLPHNTANLLGHQLTLSYFRIIYFLRGFTVFGPLVRMIQQIMEDVLPFLVILFVALFGFAMGLGIILYDNDGDFGSPYKSIVSVFNYGMIGELNDFDPAFSRDTPCETGSCRKIDNAALILYVVMMILVQIVSLNLLIAIMSDSYRLVRENSVLESAYEKAYLLLQLETTWLPALAWIRRVPTSEDSAKFPLWLHVLKPVKDDASHHARTATAGTRPSVASSSASGDALAAGELSSAIDRADILAIKARMRPLDKIQACVRRLEANVQLLAERAAPEGRRAGRRESSSFANRGPHRGSIPFVTPSFPVSHPSPGGGGMVCCRAHPPPGQPVDRHASAVEQLANRMHGSSQSRARASDHRGSVFSSIALASHAAGLPLPSVSPSESSISESSAPRLSACGEDGEEWGGEERERIEILGETTTKSSLFLRRHAAKSSCGDSPHTVKDLSVYVKPDSGNPDVDASRAERKMSPEMDGHQSRRLPDDISHAGSKNKAVHSLIARFGGFHTSSKV